MGYFNRGICTMIANDMYHSDLYLYNKATE
jgi:hypothetical protein